MGPWGRQQREDGLRQGQVHLFLSLGDSNGQAELRTAVRAQESGLWSRTAWIQWSSDSHQLRGHSRMT